MICSSEMEQFHSVFSVVAVTVPAVEAHVHYSITPEEISSPHPKWHQQCKKLHLLDLQFPKVSEVPPTHNKIYRCYSLQDSYQYFSIDA